MKEERVNFGVIIRIALSVLPVMFGMSLPAMVLCTYNIVMSFLIFGPMTCAIGSLSTIGISMLVCGLFGAAGELQGFYLGVQAVLCALACIYAIVGRRGFFTGVWLATAGYMVPSYINMYTMAHSEGQSLADFLIEMPAEMMRLQMDMMAEQSGIDMSLLSGIMEQVFEFMKMIVPSILIITSIVVGYIVMWVCCSPMRKPPISESKFAVIHSFAQLTVPKAVSVLFVVTFAGVFFIKNENAVYVLANAAMIMGSLCFFGGMSVVDFYMRRIIRSVPVRLIIHFMLYSFSAVMAGISIYVNVFTVYIILGIVASFVNIRRRKLQEEEV